MYEGTAYIPDMSCEDSKRAGHRHWQARYEARRRAGRALYAASLGPDEISALVALRWRPEHAVDDKAKVGDALAAAFRDLVRTKIF
jgi:hypothetical protein